MEIMPRSVIMFFLFVSAVIIIGSYAPAVDAETSCRQIFDPRFPGLRECTVRVSPNRVVAAPPQSQKLSLWCWAASLSMIFTESGHPISQESIVEQNFGSLVNAPGGDFLTFEGRLNRDYT